MDTFPLYNCSSILLHFLLNDSTFRGALFVLQLEQQYEERTRVLKVQCQM
jgi:hypothetical protein